MEHIRQSGPDSGLGSQVKVLKDLEIVPSSLGRSWGFAWTSDWLRRTSYEVEQRAYLRWGLGFGVWGVRFGGWGLEFREQGSGIGV